MPSRESHLTAVEQNSTVLSHLVAADQDFSPWIVTVAFYKALHVVEAVFASDPNIDIDGTDDHKSRNGVLKSNNRYQKIWRHYTQLWNDSLIARYLVSHNHGVETVYSDFSEYMSKEKVISIHLNHNLKQVIKSSQTVLGDDEFLAHELPN